MNLTPGILKGLAQFQASMPVIHKDSSGYGYKYASLDTVVRTILPLLRECGLSYAQPVGGDGATISVTTIIMAQDGGTIESTISAPIGAGKAAKMSDIQGAGSVITYLRRYSLSAILGLVTDEDTDGASICPPPPTPQERLKARVMQMADAAAVGTALCATHGVKRIAELDDATAVELLKSFEQEKK